MTSQALTLVSNPLCPFAQRAAIILSEKGAAFKSVTIDFAAKPDWFLTISPMGKVPLLQVQRYDASSAILFESMAICEYLDETLDGPAMYPDDPLERARHRGWIAQACTLQADVGGLLNAKDATVVDGKRLTIRASFERFDAAVTNGPYFVGQRFGMIDAVMAPIFRLLDSFSDAVVGPLFRGLENMSRWRFALRERPSVQSAAVSDFEERLHAHLLRQGTIASQWTST